MITFLSLVEYIEDYILIAILVHTTFYMNWWISSSAVPLRLIVLFDLDVLMDYFKIISFFGVEHIF